MKSLHRIFLSVWVPSILFLKTSDAQSGWFLPEATWYDQFSDFTVQAYIKQSVSKDTVIQGIPCKKLELFSASIHWPAGSYSEGINYRYAYEESGVVYGFSNNVFDTLYNFNTIPGDKWNITGSACMDNTAFVEVTDTGNLIFNGIELKFLEVAYHQTIYDFIPDTFIERIGSIRWGFFMNTLCTTDPVENFCSYYDSAILFYPDGDWQCDYLPTNVLEILTLNNFRVFPNPVSDLLWIKGPPIDKIEISDFTGRKIFEMIDPEFPIDPSSFSDGIFFCEVRRGNYSETVKFIKNREY